PSSAVQGIAAVTDIATAQWRLGRLGELNRIDIRLSQRKNPEEMRKAIQAHLPPGVHVSAIETLEEASATPSRSYRVNLNVLAMVALFTGGFLVFSAQALEAARRRGEHALLRVLGLTRGQLARLVLAEAAALGAAGAALGLALGYAAAQLAVRRAGADLGAGVFRGVHPQLAFQVVPALFYFAAGVAIAVLGALLPALDAARTPPARALKAGDEQELYRGATSLRPGLSLIGVGILLCFLPPVRGLPLFGYAAVGCLLLGAIALMPRVADAAFRALPSYSSPWFALALAQLRGAPGQAAISLAAI